MPKTASRPTTTPSVIQRLKFVYDEDARFEECNGEPRPLTAEEYAKNEYQGCPDHYRAGSKVVDSTTIPPKVGCAVCGRDAYVPIPYAEYLRYYGNPERHVYLGLIVQKQCPTCHGWEDTDSLWSIDLMDDDKDLNSITIGQWIDGQKARELPGYLGEMAREYIEQVGD